MNEQIHEQVKCAIDNDLHVKTNGRVTWRKPNSIRNGIILMGKSDGGSSDVQIWTPEQWREHVKEDGEGLYRQIGFWNFVRHDDPAAREKRDAFSDPEVAGELVYMLNKQVAQLTEALEKCLEVMTFSEGGEPLSFQDAIETAKAALAKARGDNND